jgi:hypothetical protein
MADSFSDVPARRAALSTGHPIEELWVVQSLPDGASRMDDLTPIEQEGARYGYQKAGQPFGPGPERLEIWLELRARGKRRAKRRPVEAVPVGPTLGRDRGAGDYPQELPADGLFEL